MVSMSISGPAGPPGACSRRTAGTCRRTRGSGRAARCRTGWRPSRARGHRSAARAAVPVGGPVLGRDRRRAKRLHPVDGGVVAAGQVGGAAHGSGSFGPTSLSTCRRRRGWPAALEPGSQDGRSASQPSGSSRPAAGPAAPCVRAHAAPRRRNSTCHFVASRPRSTSLRVWAR